ncbi:Integrase core domain containing protein [Gossypium australe]|uniref:Integrase core domain containing protein n=1 Tax=Gossypium australe TaxID=47621 RepID=A0A5B6WIF0_9ROSI|nr:Integrase core domain containing protein [Gossypium australe]
MGCYGYNDLIELIEAEIIEELGELIDVKQLENRARRSFKSLNFSNNSFKPPRPSIDYPPLLELKPFPALLKYVYLGDNNTLLTVDQ